MAKSIGPGPAAYNANFDLLSMNPSSKKFKIGIRPKISVLLEGKDPCIPDLGKYEVDQMNPNGRYPLSKYKNSSCIAMGIRTDNTLLKRISRLNYNLFLIFI